MSCEDCIKFQKTDQSFYYRWKNANIEIRGCRKHVKEIIDILNSDVVEELKKSLKKGEAE